MYSIRASKQEAQLRIDMSILTYWLQGWRKLKQPCEGSHLAKFAYINDYFNLVTLYTRVIF